MRDIYEQIKSKAAYYREQADKLEQVAALLNETAMDDFVENGPSRKPAESPAAVVTESVTTKRSGRQAFTDQDLLSYIQDSGTKGVSVHDVMEHFGCARMTAHTRINKLAHSGILVRTRSPYGRETVYTARDERQLTIDEVALCIKHRLNSQ